ncbi:DUF4145 domain-containing protein [Bacillus sp. JJ1566]|uniref:WG repeat-containing protein n=1 Tax=Bacillus sp. JJ1566 TaxID=3122961 RepID=UPI0030007C51
MDSNFKFLHSWLDLYLLGETAELYLDKDSNSSAIKCRQFVEVLTNYVLQYEKLANTNSTLANNIELLKEKEILSIDTYHLFNEVRMKGNASVHELSGSYEESKLLIFYCYQIGKWFYEKYGSNNSNSSVPAFRMGTSYKERKNGNDIGKELRNIGNLEKTKNAAIALFRTGGTPREKKFGFINPHGEVVIEPIFERMLVDHTSFTNPNEIGTIFHDGLTAAAINDKWRFY